MVGELSKAPLLVLLCENGILTPVGLLLHSLRVPLGEALLACPLVVVLVGIVTG